MKSINETTTVSTPRDRKISSMIVAAILGRQHRTILDNINKMHCSKEFALSNFVLGYYLSKKGKKQDICLMTERGLFFLAMSLKERKFVKMQNRLLELFIGKEFKCKGEIEDVDLLRASISFCLKLKKAESDCEKFIAIPKNKDSIMVTELMGGMREAREGIGDDWDNEITPDLEKLALQSTIETCSIQLTDFDTVADYVCSVLGVSPTLEQAVQLEEIEEKRAEGEVENTIISNPTANTSSYIPAKTL
jgi:Rha family phage regulatory protein